MQNTTEKIKCCTACDQNIQGEARSFEDESYCNDCYDENIRVCDSCDEHNHQEQTVYIESTDEIVSHVKSFYQEDYKLWYNSLNK